MQYSQKLFEGNKKLLYAWFQAMHTRVDIMLLADGSRDDLAKIAEQISIEIKRVESFANRFDSNSEISQINNTAFVNPIVVSQELFNIVGECLLYNKKTLGYFDITVNSANGFKDGIAHILFDKERQTIKFLHPDLRLDLSGFIKGYVLRAVRTIIQEENINHALINVGNSSILALGNHPHGIGWKISFPPGVTSKECLLHNQCLTTSGNKEETIWRILKPHTGEVIIRNQLVSVITEDPGIGEALSIALYVADEDERILILKELKGEMVNF